MRIKWKNVLPMILMLLSLIIIFYSINQISVLNYKIRTLENQNNRILEENETLNQFNHELSAHIKVKIEENYNLKKWAEQVYCGIESGSYIVNWSYLDDQGSISGHISNIKFNNFEWLRPPMKEVDCRE